MKILGIGGRARSGKNTTGEIISEEFGDQYHCLVTAFANPVKRAAQQMFGLTEEETWNDDLKDTVHWYWGITMREMFQKVGTEGGRDIFGDNLWVDRLKLEIDQFEYQNKTDKEELIVITDVRFINEIQMIKEYGYLIWVDNNKIALNEEAASHRSENNINSSMVDTIIHNNGTIEHLRSNVLPAVNHVLN